MKDTPFTAYQLILYCDICASFVDNVTQEVHMKDRLLVGKPETLIFKMFSFFCHSLSVVHAC